MAKAARNPELAGTGESAAGSPPSRHHFADWVAVCALLLTAAVIGLPIFRGGHSTYMDNPAHMAEILSLSGDAARGWSDIAYCGFPLGDLHSPLCFSMLAGWTRLGLAPEFLYAFFAWLGFCLPAGVLYFIARRRVGAPAAFLLSYLLLVQRPAIVDISSAFGGMWTFYIAEAFLLLLMDRLSRPGRGLGDWVVVSLLAAGIGLTHVFVAVALVYMFALHAIWTLLRRTRPVASLLGDAAALLLGAAASAVYWLPSFLARDSLALFRWNLPPGQILACLLLPVNMQGMLFGGRWILPALGYTDALPLILLVILGAVGAVTMARRRPLDDLPVYGGALAGVLLLLLLLVAPFVSLPVLGPSSWRHLYTVRVALALSALPLMKSLRFRGLCALSPRLAAAAGGVAILTGFWWGAPLRAETPALRGPELTDVRQLWDWLRANRTEAWGRVYLQDTFWTEPHERSLWISHVLSLTAHETGVRQVGAHYLLMAYRTSPWTRSDRGFLFGRRIDGPAQVDYVTRCLRGAHCTHLVLAEPRLEQLFSNQSGYRLLLRAGRFTVWELTGSPTDWAFAGTGVQRVRTEAYGTGAIDLTVEADHPGAEIFLAEAYHPFWRIDGPPGCRITQTMPGLMSVKDIPAGTSRLRLRYRPPRSPLLLSGAGWLCLAALAAIRGRRR